MSDQQQLRQRREALAQAVNSHDKEAVLSFIYPTFVAKSKRGWTLGRYQGVVRMMEHLFAPGIDYQETVTLEEIEVSGDSARLVVRRVARVGSRSQESSAQETWRLIDGRWLLVEERQQGGCMKTRHLLVAVAVVVAVGACVAWSVFTGTMQEFFNEWGSFIGPFGGLLGGAFGGYGSIKNANGPKERTFVLNAGLWNVIFLAVLVGLFFVLPYALPQAYVGPTFLLLFPLLLVLGLVIGIPMWNRRQAQIRAEESHEIRGPKEQAFMRKVNQWILIETVALFALILGLGIALPKHDKLWAFPVLLLNIPVTVISIPIWNRRQAQIRAEESQDGPGLVEERPRDGIKTWQILLAVIGVAALGAYVACLVFYRHSASSPLRTLTGHGKAVWSVAIAPDGTWLASGSQDQTVKVWDAQTGELKRILTGHDGVQSVAIASDGKWLASGSLDNTVKVWDVATGELKRTLNGHDDWVSSVAIASDEKWLASGSADRTVKVWDAQTGELKRTLTGHGDVVYSVAIAPDGKWLASGSLDKTVKVWDAQMGELKRTLTGHRSSVLSVAIAPDGTWLASGSGDNTVKVWDAQTGELKRTLTGHDKAVYSVAIARDGTWLASGSWDQTVKVWDAQTGELKRTLTGHDSTALSVAIAPDGKWMVSGSADTTVKVWDVSNKK